MTKIRRAQERATLSVVSDQHGSPTWSRTIADVTAHIVAQSLAAENTADWWQARSGLYHLTSQCETTWHGFTAAVLAHRSVERKPARVPILARD
jgi:dTDP-4-dehydrorhamnose reductase